MGHTPVGTILPTHGVASIGLRPAATAEGSAVTSLRSRSHSQRYTSAVAVPLTHAAYPSTLPAMAWLAFQRRPRSFRRDSRMLVDRLTPSLRVEGALPDVEHGSWLVVVNHYTRPGFRAWWIPMAISATLPREVCWVTTSTLTFRDPLRAATITPASRWFLRHVARLYGFVAMPPMPPRDVRGRRARRGGAPGAAQGVRTACAARAGARGRRHARRRAHPAPIGLRPLPSASRSPRPAPTARWRIRRRWPVVSAIRRLRSTCRIPSPSPSMTAPRAWSCPPSPPVCPSA